MSSTWGERVKISIFGGSHTPAIGVNIDGLPAGERIDWSEILVQMKRRAPGQDATATTRKERDLPKILCGVNEQGILTGDPVCGIIENTSQRSEDYDNLLRVPRPGHADYAAYVKYRGNNDIRGGGHFSGRLTAPLVLAGAICRQILRRRGVEIGAHGASVGAVRDRMLDPVHLDPQTLKELQSRYFSVLDPEAGTRMVQRIEEARIRQDSVGGTIECGITGLPVGLGGPMFDGVENKLAGIVLGIPGIKGIAFGDGFDGTSSLGSEHNDPYYMDEFGGIRTRTNHAGGILGGMTNGMPLIFKVAVKPTPSIARPQESINVQSLENTELMIKGRHDPCILPRAIPVVEAAAAVAMMDLWMMEWGTGNDRA